MPASTKSSPASDSGVGVSEERGLNVKVPFYWAISENSDATFILDTYTESGIGTGVEYRFVGLGGVKSNWWIYHIRDSRLNRDFVEVRGLYENRSPERPGGFLNINYVNEKDFFREFSLSRDTRTQRFLESTGEFAMPFAGGRLYLLSQYWVDLKHSNGNVPQKLPEAGYVMNYTGFGSFMFSGSATAANIWREDGISARRFDIYPRLLHSAGSDFVLTQIAAVEDHDAAPRAGQVDGGIEARETRAHHRHVRVLGQPLLREARPWRGCERQRWAASPGGDQSRPSR